MNGTSAAPIRIIGSSAARHEPSRSPKTAIDPAATIEVSGIQCPLLGTGSIGSAGRRPPTSRKLHSTGHAEAVAGGQLLADQLVVGGVGVRRVVDQEGGGEPGDERQGEEDGQVAAHQRRTQMAAVSSR